MSASSATSQAQPGSDINIPALQSFLSIYPTPENLVRVCGDLFTRGHLKLALQLAVHVAAENADNAALSLTAATLISGFVAEHTIIAHLLKNVLRLLPENIQVKIHLADALMGAGHITEACDLYSELIAQHPERRAKLYEHISKHLLDCGYSEQAYLILKTWFESGDESASDPGHSILNNMACALVRLQRSEEALVWYRRAVEKAPDNAGIFLGYSIAMLKAGHYKEGFAAYATRPPATGDKHWWFMDLPRFSHRHFTDDISGRHILLYQEQGYGDSLHFIRFVPALIEKGAFITLAVPRQLLRLMQFSFAKSPQMTVQELYLPDAHPKTPEDGKYEFAAPIPDLPSIIGLASPGILLEQKFPYLRADTAEVAKFATLLPQPSHASAPRPLIGLVWAGERRFTSDDVATDKRRSTSLADMLTAFGTETEPLEATLVSLQFGAPRQELETWHGQTVFDPMDSVSDMADTAALIENIDLLVSVDTSPVHLAGGLDKPVWMISRKDACWRWGDHGSTSPWYPKLRIFRSYDVSFIPALRDVGTELRQWIRDWQRQAGQSPR